MGVSESTGIPLGDANRADVASYPRDSPAHDDRERVHVLRRLLALLGWTALVIATLLGAAAALGPWVVYLAALEVPTPPAGALTRAHLSPTDLALISGAATMLLLAACIAVLAVQVGRAVAHSRRATDVATASVVAVRFQLETLQRHLDTAHLQMELTRDALAASQEHCDHIARLDLFPQLAPDLQLDNENLKLRVLNPGAPSALDVDVWPIGVYTKDDQPLAHFIAQHARPDIQSELLDEWTAGEAGQYGIFDCLTFSVFPGRRQVEMPLRFPVTPSYVYVHLQFRDIVGRNYLYSYGFVRHFGDGYRLGGKDPVEVVESARLDPNQGGGEWIRNYFSASGLPRSSSRQTLEWIDNIARSRLFFGPQAEDADARPVWSDV